MCMMCLFKNKIKLIYAEKEIFPHHIISIWSHNKHTFDRLRANTSRVHMLKSHVKTVNFTTSRDISRCAKWVFAYGKIRLTPAQWYNAVYRSQSSNTEHIGKINKYTKCGIIKTCLKTLSLSLLGHCCMVAFWLNVCLINARI